MKQRSLVEVILLSIFTCGIYMLYWNLAVYDETTKTVGNGGFGMGVNLLLIFVTCGLWLIFLQFKIAENIYVLDRRDNLVVEEITAFVVVVMLLSAMVVSTLIIQDRINRYCQRHGIL